MPINPYLRTQSIFGNPTQVQPKVDFGVPAPTRKPVQFIDEDQDDEVSALERFKNAVLNPPQNKFNWLRALGTGLYSAIREKPDETMETVVIEPGKKGKPAIPQRVNTSISSTGKKSYTIVAGHPAEPDEPETRRVTTQTKKGQKWNPLSFAEAEEIMNMPHQKRMEDWKITTQGLERAAQEERQAANTEGLINKRIQDAVLAQTREGRLGKEGERRLDQGDERLRIQNRIADLNEWKARNPNGQIREIKGGNIVVINPQSGEVIDTGIPSGSLSDEDRLRLQGEIRSGQIEQQGAIRSGQIDQQGQIRDRQISQQNQNTLGQIAARGNETRTTKGTPSAPTTHTSVKSDGSKTTTTKTESKKTPIAQQTQPIIKRQRNKKTGETRTVQSTDGGKTWKVVK